MKIDNTNGNVGDMDDNKNTKVLVTGGAGFIGSHIVERLVREGYGVRVFDNFSTGTEKNLKSVKDKIEIFEGDIRNKEDILKAVEGVDNIFHEAALVSVPDSIKNPHKCWKTNITGTIHLLNAANKSNVKKIIFASSAAIYGNDPKIPKRESMKAYPASPYAESKIMGEESFIKYEKHFNMKCMCLRYFNVYGPRQDPNSQYSGVISKFIGKMLNKEQPIVFGDGKQTRDFVYVNDIVNANMLAMKSKIHGKIANIGTGEETSLLELLGTLNNILGENLKPKFKSERTGDVKYSYADISVANYLLKYKPTTSLENGLKETIKWINKRK